MKIAYTPREFSSGSLAVIKTANDILESYAAQGFDLTLRQLYYQFVARGLIANKDTEYKKLGSIINDARLAGLVDWDHITDRTRNMRQNSHWDSPKSIIDACAASFQLDKWKDQRNYVEVWVEKDALVGVLEVACAPLDVPYFSCRGYTSQSEMWAASQRLLQRVREGKQVHIIHLGDHDPSGIDMSRDIEDRLSLFLSHHVLRDYVKQHPRTCDEKTLRYHETPEDYSARIEQALVNYRPYALPVTVNRIALNMSQIRQYDPPPNPAKVTDSRAKSYIEEYGEESWELDALEPAVLTALIQDAVGDLRNDDVWASASAIEENYKANLQECARRWQDVERLLQK